MSRDDRIIGVSDHGGWAVLVTVAGNGTLLDRRRVELVDEDLPKIPHHSEGQALPLHEAVALVERVRVSAERHAKLGLDAVAMTVPARILGIAASPARSRAAGCFYLTGTKLDYWRGAIPTLNCATLPKHSKIVTSAVFTIE